VPTELSSITQFKHIKHYKYIKHGIVVNNLIYLYNKLEHVTLKRWQKISLSFSGIDPHDGQGLRNCCLIVFVIACEATIDGTNLQFMENCQKMKELHNINNENN